MENENLNKLIKGGIGVTKASLGIDKSSDSLIKKRLRICEDCEFKKVKLKKDICSKCGCILSLKTKINSEKCPIGKW